MPANIQVFSKKRATAAEPDPGSTRPGGGVGMDRKIEKPAVHAEAHRGRRGCFAVGRAIRIRPARGLRGAQTECGSRPADDLAGRVRPVSGVHPSARHGAAAAHRVPRRPREGPSGAGVRRRGGLRGRGRSTAAAGQPRSGTDRSATGSRTGAQPGGVAQWPADHGAGVAALAESTDGDRVPVSRQQAQLRALRAPVDGRFDGHPYRGRSTSGCATSTSTASAAWP